MQRIPEDLHADLTAEIIGAFYHVYNTLGHGFLESVYQNALMVTLRKRGHSVEVRQPVQVRFESVIVGNYFADLIVNRVVIIELKSVETLCEAHESQLLNYLRATDIEVGLLLNFPNSRKIGPACPQLPEAPSS